jgi:lipoprotein NlpI
MISLARAASLWLVILLAICAGLVRAQAAEPSRAEFKDVALAAGAFSRGDALPSWVEPVPMPPGDTAKPLFIRLADVQLLVGDTHIAFVNRAIQANDPAALGQIGQQQIVFVPQYQRLRLHGVRLLRGEEVIDKTQSVNMRFLQRETGLEQGVYSGMVSAVLLIDDIRAGDTLHLVYSVEGDNPVFGNRYSEFAGWDDVDAVGLRRVTLSHPAQRNIEWRMLGDAKRLPVQPEIREEGGMRRLRFVERNLPAVEFEPQMPQSYQAFRVLQFSEFRSWNEVVKWAAPLFEPRAQLPSEALGVIERLRALPSRDARISAALQWVQSEVRYFSVALGESSHRPHQPDVVLQRRYGDCKDKSLLLISLLRQLGIEAWPVLVSVSTKNGMDRLLPTPLAFDHVIVLVQEDGNRFYLDPARSGQRGRLSRMGQALESAEVIVVAPDTAGLTKIVTPNIGELVRHEIRERITLSSMSGEGSVELHQTYNGVQAESIRTLLPRLKGDQLRKFATQGYESRYPDAGFVGEPRIQDDAELNTVTVISRFTTNKISVADEEGWRLVFNPANFSGAFPLPKVLRRSFPVAVPTHPYEARYSLEVRLPKEVSAQREPYERKVENRHFTFRHSGEFRGNRAKYELALRTRHDTIGAGELPQVFEDIAKVSRLASGHMWVAKYDLKQPWRAPNAFQDSVRERLRRTVNHTTRTIRSGRLTGDDLAEVLCLRAEALAYMGTLTEGMNDALEAVRQAPSLARAYECRANVSFSKGDFARAISDYTQALSLGSHLQNFYRRGQARLYLGQLAEAAEDFAKAAAHDSDASAQLYAGLWHASVLKRLGRSLPDALVQRAQEDPRGAWPRPALAMLCEQLSSTEMLSEVERLQGDARELALVEAWFYLGQHHLLRGEPGAAREAFEKAREKGVSMYIEHVAAGFELDRLGAKQ